MKAPATVPIPPRLAARPRWHGLPVPFIATITPTGEPDFRVVDALARLHSIFFRRCQLCGETLGKAVFFVGGPQAAAGLAYFEPATHLDCLIYAMQVCPFIAGTMKHADMAVVQADNPTLKVFADATYTTEKSEWWVIVKASNYQLIQQSDETILVRPNPVVFTTDRLHAATMNAAEWAAVGQQLFNA